MSYFFYFDLVPDLTCYISRSPMQRLIDKQNLAFLVYIAHSKFFLPECIMASGKWRVVFDKFVICPHYSPLAIYPSLFTTQIACLPLISRFLFTIFTVRCCGTVRIFAMTTCFDSFT